MTHGSRFTAGYQFGRTDHAGVRRDPPLKTATITRCAGELALVPLVGGRITRFSLEAQWTELQRFPGQPEARPTSVAWSMLVDDREDALRAFVELEAGFRDGEFPAGLA